MTDAPFARGVYAIINPAQEYGVIATLSGAQTNPQGKKKLLNNTVLKMYFVLEKQSFPSTANVRLFWFANLMLHSGAWQLVLSLKMTLKKAWLDSMPALLCKVSLKPGLE